MLGGDELTHKKEDAAQMERKSNYKTFMIKNHFEEKVIEYKKKLVYKRPKNPNLITFSE